MTEIRINGRRIGSGHPVFVIAELSGNHNGDKQRAIDLVRRAADAGVDAVKVQTYTPDTLTIDADTEWFVVPSGTPWATKRLFDLYAEAQTPWEWIADLRDAAVDAGVTLFSTAFDARAVRLHEELHLPANKIASFELVDHELVAAAAATSKPLILSTGMASEDEIDAAVDVARRNGATELALLHCNSSYPAPPEEMNLATIPAIAARWDVPVGLSDHTLGTAAATAAVALGASIIEKHVCLSRDDPGPDTSFSLEPAELGALVTAVRDTERAIGSVHFGATATEQSSLVFRRSLFVVDDVDAGDTLTRDNVRSIRPGHGLAPAELPKVLGRRAARPIRRGTPLSWDLID